MTKPLLAIAAFLFSLPSAQADCPPLAAATLKDATQLILITTDNWTTFGARLQLWTRPTPSTSAWKSATLPLPAVIGRSGMAWGNGFTTPDGPQKHEGDGKSPAGVFPLGQKFGFEPTNSKSLLVLQPSTVCVDDPASAHYNSIVDSAIVPVDWKSAEKMREIQQYRFGFDVNYASSAKGLTGSCIFLHVWKSEADPTSGCMASRESTLQYLHGWVRPEAKPVVAFLPAPEFKRFAECMPGVAPAPSSSGTSPAPTATR